MASAPARSPRRFTRSFAALASALPVFRPGTTSPGGSAGLSGAPITAGKARRAAPSRVRRALKISTGEGMLAEVVTACAGGAVLTGYAMHLGASPVVIGLVAALPQLAHLVQLPAAFTTRLLGHRRASLWMVGLSRQALLPLIALPFLPLGDASKQLILLGVAAFSAALGVLGNNAWVAWMGELVPERLRGRYFGRRTGLCLFAGAAASAGSGLALDTFRADGRVGLALAGLAVLACLAGAVTSWLLSLQHDPETMSDGERLAAPQPPRSPPTLAQSTLPFRDPDARGFLVYQLVWNGAVGLAASYFALHMLRNLEMGFTMMAVHGTAVAFVRMLAAPLWGRAIDRLGAKPVLLFCSYGVSIIPLLWLFPTPQMLLLPLALDVLLSGILWGGHGVAAFALPLSLAPREGRPFYLGAFAMVGGVAFTIATAAGGLIAQAVPDRFTLMGHELYDLHVLFLLTAVARVGAASLGLRIAEPGARRVPELLRMMPRLLVPQRVRARTAP